MGQSVFGLKSYIDKWATKIKYSYPRLLNLTDHELVLMTHLCSAGAMQENESTDACMRALFEHVDKLTWLNVVPDADHLRDDSAVAAHRRRLGQGSRYGKGGKHEQQTHRKDLAPKVSGLGPTKSLEL